MIFRDTISVRAGGGWVTQLFSVALLMLAAFPALAVNCSDPPYFGVIDGNVHPPPDQVQIDGNCTIRNYPASNPLSTNFSFLTQPGQTQERWLVVFDNVVHLGNMSCNAVHEHKIWFTNGSSSKIKQNCQNLLIPVEKIEKQNPAGQTTAVVGTPFTYRLVIPVLFDPATGGVINFSGSPNDLHGITIWDDLNATGADLTYLSHTAYWLDSGTEVPHTFSNVGGLLTFVVEPIIPAEEQMVIEITVVLDESSANVVGTQFVNTAKWEFGRLIDDIFYQPLPGEWGVTPPMTIVGPDLAMTKTGPATLNLGELGTFTLDIQNVGNGDAWEMKILDRLPDGAGAGMCDFTPNVLSARVFAADGVTPVAGKGPLTAGSDYFVNYSGAPACELSLEILTAAGAVAPDERLIVRYQTKLDAGSQQGAALTNVAGAIEWFHVDPAGSFRQSFTRELTDGTVGVLDHEDAHTLSVELAGYFFEKTVANLTTGVSPAATAAPGDTLRYTLRLRAIDDPFSDVTFRDDMGALNASSVFQPGTLTLVAATLPPGADTSNTSPGGGTNGAGVLDIRNMSLAANSEVAIQFDIRLRSTLIDGAVVLNQADLLNGGIGIGVSDDPNINGPADPFVPGDEDPTRVVIETVPPEALTKANTQATAAVGEPFSYRLTVPSVPHSAPLYDVRILDDLTASAADLRFVSVRKVSGAGPWTPVNTGTGTHLVIEDPVNGIDIPAGQQVVIEITVQLLDTLTNVAGLAFTNTASYTYNLINNSSTSTRLGGSGTTGPMTIVEPELTLDKGGPIRMLPGVPGTFSLNVHNVGDSPAFALTITDRLPNTPAGGMCAAAPTQVTAQLFQADGVTPAAPALVSGTDYALEFTGAPDCLFTLTMLTPAAAIGPDQRLIVSYRTVLDPDSEQDASLTNVAAATSWFSTLPPAPNDQAREYTRLLTNGTVGVLDHEDAHTVSANLPILRFEKTVANVTRGDDPGTVATPGDTLRYRLVIENLSEAVVGEFSILDQLDRLNDPAAFQAGSLQLITVPPGANAASTSATGGTRGTGVVDIRNLSLGGLNDSLLIEFEITLAPVIANGRWVLNQSQLIVDGVPIADSDDPNVNGTSDPLTAGDEDPTRIRIESAPVFRTEKVSAYISGDPDVLLAGETLRYTITVKNIGTDNAVDAVVRDAIPTNTTYVAGSTTLNGEPLADPASGIAPLSDGIQINAPEDPTPGAMRADASETQENVATITFDVVVNEDVVDGTVISNQAFVSAQGSGVTDQPSDDPRTPVVDDPTRDVVGNSPALVAEKAVALFTDAGTPGIVDPGDVLRYTITLHNFGNVAATGVELSDAVPADTAYVADSTYLDDLPVDQPDGGVSPLIAGIAVSSSDLTPPLPGPGAGTLSPGGTAVVRFDVRINDGVPSGTIISNQGLVATAELPNQLTDGDGNPDNGAQPTQVVVGDGQQLSITKQVSVVGGGTAEAGALLEYVVRVTNIASVPAFDVVLTDDLDAPAPGQLSFVAGTATMNGAVAGIAISGSVLTAGYSAVSGPLQPGQSFTLRFRAVINPDLPIGTTVTNVAVVTWNTPVQTESASVSVDVGGTPGVGMVNGTAWHDANFDGLLDANERVLEGWTVELHRNERPLHSVPTDADGTYRMSGLGPNDTSGDRYEIRFLAPGAGPNTAALGEADSPFTNGPQRIADIIVASGSNLQDLNLPIDPNGVVYNSVVRTPVAGATLMMLQAGSGAALPGACFDDAAQQNQVTRSDGYYKFDLNFSDPACPSGGSYVVGVTAPPSGYVAGYSQIIPPVSGPSTAPFAVPACPGSAEDAIPATSLHCETQASELAPPVSARARSAGTNYHVHLSLDGGQVPGSSQLFNNHIPLDPVLDGAVAITKTTPAVNVSRGQLVPYEITINNTLGVNLPDLSIVDRYPAGFRYIDGSARLDGVAVEPVLVGRELYWNGVEVPASGRRTLLLLLAVGAGVGEGEYVNRAQVVSQLSSNAVSGEASATVRVVPDPTFDCTDVTGKVFDDANRNGVQDGDEHGLPGVRLVTARGLSATTDEHGRYHITCATVPRESRGSNFVLKLDDRTLPSGFRMSTGEVLVKRATRGKALRFNFGASLHRVVALDIADAVFEPDSTEMRPQWKPRIQLLLEELRKAPAVLRLSYVADLEDADLVERRLDTIKREIGDAWKALDCCYQLTVEPEVFWRRGGPVRQSALQRPDGR